jgi:tetratricopeptide (TPR) repeat protein
LRRSKEAIEHIEIAIKLDPNDPLIKGLYGFDLLFVHRYNDAITVSLEARKIDPTNSPAFNGLLVSLHMTGRYTEALEYWKSGFNINYPGLIHAFNIGYAKAGYIGALSLEADTLVAQSKTANVNPGDLSWLYVCSGNKERALDYLERCYEVHDLDFIYLSLPIFDCLSNEPRFQVLCKRMNLSYK